jgi:hypothetical protein
VRARRAFTLLELHVSIAVLVTGLLSMVWLLSVQGKQMKRAEGWCRGDPTYYVVSQPNRWMRKLDASARLDSQAGQPGWTPPVTGTQKHQLLLESCSRNPDGNQMTARVTLQGVGG